MPNYEYPCRCHAHGVGHLPATRIIPLDISLANPIPKLCQGCFYDGCDADRPLPNSYFEQADIAEREIEKRLLFSERYGTRLQDAILVETHYTREEVIDILKHSKLPDSFKEWLKKMDDEYEPGPDMVRVFAKVNKDTEVVAIVDDVPRASGLEDYYAYDVEADVWYEFVKATERLEEAKREAETAMALHSEAFEKLHDMLRR